MLDGREARGNSLGRKPWEIAWAELRCEGARWKYGHRGADAWGARTTDGKPWEIAWGELRWEGARRKHGHRGRMGNCGK